MSKDIITRVIKTGDEGQILIGDVEYINIGQLTAFGLYVDAPADSDAWEQDNKTMLGLLSLKLEREGFEVVDPEAALSAIDKITAMGGPSPSTQLIALRAIRWNLVEFTTNRYRLVAQHFERMLPGAPVGIDDMFPNGTADRRLSWLWEQAAIGVEMTTDILSLQETACARWVAAALVVISYGPEALLVS